MAKLIFGGLIFFMACYSTLVAICIAARLVWEFGRWLWRVCKRVAKGGK